MNNQDKVTKRPLFFDGWLWKMAWRDSRQNRSRLFLFMSAIIIGVAALVAISSFGDNLKQAVQDQAKSILGADLLMRSRQAFTEPGKAMLDSIGGQQSYETAFASMAFFPKNQNSRLVQIRGLGDGFPFYGEIETTPATAASAFRDGRGALVDQSLLLQYDLQVGDSVRIGASLFAIVGRLDKVPGQNEAAAAIAPRVYIPLNEVEKTNLIRFGSRVFYNVYFKFDNNYDVSGMLDAVDEKLHEENITAVTADQRSRSLGNVMNNLYGFLNLVAFTALLLGGIGVASSVHVYIRQKLASVAVLRCVGASIAQTFSIYLIQTGVMGLIGAILGAALGVAIQLFLPQLFSDFLVVDLEFTVSWPAILKGLVVGFGMTLLFALLPLLAVRNVSPLMALRASFEEKSAVRDIPRLLTLAVLGFSTWLFAVYQTGSGLRGTFFTVGVFAAFLILAGVAKLLIWAVRRFFPGGFRYELRQSLANLYRPNNQTLILVTAIGLGAFQITTLYLTQNSLLNQVTTVDAEGQPNMILFDIQVDQQEAIEEIVRQNDLPVMQSVPIVTMRLASVKGQSVQDIRGDSTSTVPNWALVREYRSTYRDSLNDTEEIIAGSWQGRIDPVAGPIPVSLDEGIAENLGVTLGDSLGINVQGVVMDVVVGSLRKVNWQRVQPNFLILFPSGILEDAPQIYVVVTRTPTAEASAKLQREVISGYPNVSAVDTTLIVHTVRSILDRISFIIRFMALFSILTGLIVLMAAVITTRFQRARESVLLRTLGARTSQIRSIIGMEYIFLGCLSALTGILLAMISTWILSYYVFDVVFVPDFTGMLLIGAGIALLTGGLGIANSRGIATRSPLEILRAEG
ncbi:MAG: ABC transporter permease [Calditrichia bacterium]